MTFLKKGFQIMLASVMLFTTLSMSAVPAVATSTGADVSYTASASTPEEMIAKMENTYRGALSRAGRSSFYNRCSQLVNYSTVVLGLQTERYNGNGRDEYNLYQNISRTDCGYDVKKYPATEYSLKSALNAISDNGTKDVTNIIIGWQSGSSYASRRYGHTCFIHGILDGNVYFYESYGLKIGGRYYSAGEPIVCTIAEFADYYDGWGVFEGAVHFEFPDDGAPDLSRVQVLNASEEGFTLTFYASDNAMTDLYAKVWTYGNSEEDGCQILPVALDNGVAAVRVNTADFDGFVGKYYATCYAEDAQGNVSSTTLAEGDCVDLYTAECAEGTYRVREDATGVHNAPYAAVNGLSTEEYTMDADSKFEIVGSWVNDLGETWYQLEDGSWVNAQDVKRQIQLSEAWEYVNTVFRGEASDSE